MLPRSLNKSVCTRILIFRNPKLYILSRAIFYPLYVIKVPSLIFIVLEALSSVRKMWGLYLVSQEAPSSVLSNVYVLQWHLDHIKFGNPHGRSWTFLSLWWLQNLIKCILEVLKSGPSSKIPWIWIFMQWLALLVIF